MTSRYDEIKELWLKDVDISKKWWADLYQAVCNFRSHFEEFLGVEGRTWEKIFSDDARKYPYVYLTDLNGELLKLSSFTQTFVNDWSVRFNLKIILERTENAYPKYSITIPLIVKYTNHVIDYSFYNTEQGLDRGFAEHWYRDVDEFAQHLFESLKNYYSFNPFEEEKPRKKIGFLQEQEYSSQESSK